MDISYWYVIPDSSSLKFSALVTERCRHNSHNERTYHETDSHQDDLTVPTCFTKYPSLGHVLVVHIHAQPASYLPSPLSLDERASRIFVVTSLAPPLMAKRLVAHHRLLARWQVDPLTSEGISPDFTTWIQTQRTNTRSSSSSAGGGDLSG
jgi:hypothetical protein